MAQRVASIADSVSRFDAFTQKPTSQHSLAFEKASLIFNISAVLSCYAAVQNRNEESGLKTAFHSFQASAGMFTYINENFLHAPSKDLNHQTIRTLINVMLAQAQEVFLEKQIEDQKKTSLLAKLAAQTSFLYSQCIEGLQENVNNAVFENVWLQIAQVKVALYNSMGQFYQAVQENEAERYGIAIARLQAAEASAKDAYKQSCRIPDAHPINANIGTEAAQTLSDLTKKQRTNVQEKLTEYNKDNDFIYHAPVPSESSLAAIQKTAAAKAISVSELYQGQDIHRIIGPDIFQKIVPMSVTESASLYDEEKAKLARAEAERVETADSEMAASLDYLKLPNSLNILKGGMSSENSVDESFRKWCEDLAGQPPFHHSFDELSSDKTNIVSMLDQCSKSLDMEESVCEKMRSRYGADWTQQPSSRLTATLRSDIRNYRSAIDEAGTSDAQLLASLRQNEGDFDEMRKSAESGEVDVLYQRAMAKAGAARGQDGASNPSSPQHAENLIDEDFDEDGASVSEQISQVEELLRKLNLVKRERAQVLQDLKDKIHSDDISQVLILNKRAITTQDHQLFKQELEKFKPHQTRILQAIHKQSTVLKDLTRSYSNLLQDKRVRSEQSKYESFSRQKTSVLTRYRRAHQSYQDLNQGLERARVFYSEMKGTVESLKQNVDTFVSNRKAEGGELLSAIEKGKAGISAAGSSAGDAAAAAVSNADRDADRLKGLMDRMNMGGNANKAGGINPPPPPRTASRPAPLQNIPTYAQQPYNPATSPPINSGGYPNPKSAGYGPPMQSPPFPGQFTNAQSQRSNGFPTQYASTPHGYNPNMYGPVSPPPGGIVGPSGQRNVTSPGFPPHQQQQQQQQQPYAGQGVPSGPKSPAQLPAGYVPPPPPPRQAGGGAHARGPSQQQAGQGSDPFAGLSGWR